MIISCNLEIKGGVAYYISSMNLAASGEEETKTIKYLNNSGSEQGQHSESATEKQFEQELLLARKIFHTSKSNPKHIHDAGPPNCKIVFIETLNKYDHPLSATHQAGPLAKPKHKKGKSVDLQELITSSREDKKHSKQQGSKDKGKGTYSKQINIDLKERKSISQMKHYQYESKKLGGWKQDCEGRQNFKKKKSKSIQSGQLRNLKKQIRKFIDETPIYIQRKKESAKQTHKTQRHQPTHINSKNTKLYSKSEEIFSESKAKKKQVSKHKNDAQLREASFSMPMTSKIINLLSNNSSVFNSQKQLSVVRNHSFVIPTEESLDQIDQIRQYQHNILRKSSSDRLRHARKATPINQLLQEEVDDSKESTTNIINYYVKKFEEAQRQAQNDLNQDFNQLSYIPDKNSQKKEKEKPGSDMMLGSLNFEELQDISQCQSIKLDNSDIIESNAIKQQQAEINKLNCIIEQIEKKGDKMETHQKEVILQKIKMLITASAPSTIISKEDKVEDKSKKDDSNIELSNSELKESFGLEKDMSQLNLEMLDKALRERETYLTQRKDKELEKLEEIYDDSDLSHEKEKIIRWIDHEIKSVVQTRHQLWKGFHLAKEFLESSKQSRSEKKKKGDMMKCLSEKYLQRNVKAKKENEKKDKRGTEKQQHRQKALGSESDQDGLGEGRIAEAESAINIDAEQEEEEQLLSSAKPLRQSHEQPDKKGDYERQDSSSDSDYDYDKNNVLFKPLSQASNEKVHVSQTTGLNLKQIECDIQYEDSFNQQDLQKLEKQSQKVNQSTMKIPFDLSIEDKEDIYQFIFLDLCVELTDEYSLNSPIIQRIFSFIKNMREQAKKQKGFKTNTNVIKEYLFEFISFLKTKQDMLQEVYQNLDKPLGPTAIDILRYMHPYDEDPAQEEGNDTVFILDIKMFEKFQHQFLGKIQFETYYDDDEKQKRRRAFLKNAIHIHNKAIFDALNETLDKERPFGVWGEPFSWKKIAKFYHQRDIPTKNTILLKSAQKTIQYGAYMCGFMVDKEQCNLKSNPNITQAYIDQIRDDRLSRMLATDLDEGEEKMLFIDDEQTEILVEVAQLIYHSLIQEACQEYGSFH